MKTLSLNVTQGFFFVIRAVFLAFDFSLVVVVIEVGAAVDVVVINELGNFLT
jgi:hypothetical protein